MRGRRETPLDAARGRPAVRAALLLAAFVLAGCLGDDAPSPAPATAPTPTVAAPEPAPPPVRVPLAFDGRYPNAAYACHGAVGCQGTETGPYANGLKVEKLDGNVTGVRLVMTWTAGAPTMERMGLAVMVMYPRSCEACKSVEFATAKGPSPLKLEYAGPPVPIDPRGALHVYFYALNAANEPVAVEADAETAVRVEGAATLAPP